MDHDYTNHIMPRKPRPTQRRYNTIPLFLLLTVLAWIMLGYAVFAQSSESGSVSGASSEVDVVTGAIAGSAINNYGQKPGKDNRTYQEVATAPSLGGLALGGGHPCAYSPATFQVSVIGSGAGVGGSKVDSACMLMVMGAAGDAKAYKAAQLMLASRDPAACAAMEQAGILDCVTKEERRAKATTTPAKSSKSAAGTGAKCNLTGKKLMFQPTSKAARNAELSACKALYGL